MLKRFFYWLIVCIMITGLSQQPALAAEREEVAVPILMYHKVSADPSRWGKYAISPDEFEADLKYLRDEGYSAVTMAQLADYVKNEGTLPEKPIVITVDDGACGDYIYIFTALQKYEMPAVISIIGCITDKYSEESRQDIRYPHILWDEIREMTESGLVEIQNHGYDLHDGKGVYKIYGESETEYEKRLSADIMRLQDRIYEMTGTYPNTFTYPFGGYNAKSEELLRKLGFSASLVCEERINLISAGKPECLFRLGRLIRPHGKPLDRILN